MPGGCMSSMSDQDYLEYADALDQASTSPQAVEEFTDRLGDVPPHPLYDEHENLVSELRAGTLTEELERRFAAQANNAGLRCTYRFAVISRRQPPRELSAGVVELLTRLRRRDGAFTFSEADTTWRALRELREVGLVGRPPRLS
jgi:hypothetical protein